MKQLVVFGDFDSLAYTAGRAETISDMQQVVNNKLSLLIKRCNTDKVMGWLEVCSNKQNFRNHVSTTRIYKGNRKRPKPHLLNEAKRYLVDQGYARWCNYIESEDRMLIEVNKYGAEWCIMAYIDKDCRQQWGRVYDYKKDELYSISPREAELHLYTQFLTGDSTDNIKGISDKHTPKELQIGPVRAQKILGELSVDELPMAVAKEYALRGHSYDYLLEQCRLLYLLRTDGDVFHYPISREVYDALPSES